MVKKNKQPKVKKVKVKKPKTKKPKTPAVHKANAGFDIGRYDYKFVSTHHLKFAKLYNDTRLWPRYLIAVVIGILMGFTVQLLIKNSGLYSAGLSAITQGISRLVRAAMSKNDASATLTNAVYNILFWGLYFVCNIPLFVLGYMYIGKTFAKLTIVFLIVNTLSGLGFSYIPHMDEIFLFGDTRPTGWNATGVLGHPNNLLYDNGVMVIPFSFSTDYVFSGGKEYLLYDQHDSIKSFYLAIYALCQGLINAVFCSLLYIISACGAGLDFVSFFYSVKKGKSVKNVLLAINLLSMFLGSFMGSYCAGGMIYKDCWSYQWLLSANFVFSALAIIVYRITLSFLYPNDKYVRVDVYTTNENAKAIISTLKAAKYQHTSSLIPCTGAFLGTERKILQTICTYSELPRVIEYVRKVDQKSFIVAYEIKDMDGMITVQKTGSVE